MNVNKTLARFLPLQTRDSNGVVPASFHEALLNAISDLGGGVLITESRRVVYANDAFARLVGYTPDELLAIPSYLELVVPAERDAVLSRARQFHSSGDHYETTLLHRDGRELMVEVSTKPLTSEPPQRSVALVRDITERKQVESTLRTWRNRVMAILASIADGFFMLDHDSRFTFVNHQIELLLGRPASELLGKVIWDEFPQAVERWKPYYDRALNYGQPQHVEQRSTVTDRWLEAHLYPSVEGVSVYVRDISARKLGEQQLQQRNRELETITAIMTAINSASDLHQSLRSALEHIATLCEMDAAECILYSATGKVELAVAYQLDDQIVQSAAPLDDHGGLARLAFRHDEPVYIPDLRVEPSYRRRALAYAHGFRSLLSVPIVSRSSKLGILTLYSRTPRDFTSTPQGMLMTIGVQLGMAIERARLLKVSEAHAAEMRHSSVLLVNLSRIALKFETQAGTTQLFESLNRAARRARYGYVVFMYDARRQTFQLRFTSLSSSGTRAVDRLLGRPLNRFRLRPPDFSILHSVAQTHLPVILHNLPQRAPHWFPRIDPRKLSQILAALTITSRTHVALIPMLQKGELLGVLALWGARLTRNDLAALTIFASELTVAYENARLFEQLTGARARLLRLTQQLITAQEEERRRISRELHDEAGQALTALKINLSLMRSSVSQEDVQLRENLEEMMNLVDSTTDQLRLISHDLRPPALDTLGLSATLASYCSEFAKRTHLTVDYTGDPLDDVPGPYSITLYRFLQEGLTNVAKHAHATRVWVNLQRSASHLSLTVTDDGIGLRADALALETPHTAGGIGLSGMLERLELLGGELSIEAEPGAGVCLKATIPWKETA